MFRIGFDNEEYIRRQSAHIRERIAQFGGKLYLEFGGKLFDDHHASRVLPGFEPDSKIRMLVELAAEAEIVIVLSAADIEKNKVRGDLGITYDQDTLRLIDAFRDFGLYVGSVVLTRYTGQPAAMAFGKRLESLGLKVYHHYSIPGYPSDVEKIVSDEGYGINQYIETSRSLVVVTAPGPGSGKMATCLSQLYHDNKRGIRSGYAKFETFPVWNLGLKHPVNLAYEAATADLNDVNMIDPFHLEAYGETAVNYNRDVDIFPVVKAMFEHIYGSCPYKSPTDMGVNMAGYCIIDNDAVYEAARDEILRRYYRALCAQRKGEGDGNDAAKIKMIMRSIGLDEAHRPVIGTALARAEETGGPAVALQLRDGRIVTGKTSKILGATSAMLLNALKALAGIPKEVDLISPEILAPVSALKVKQLGDQNPRLYLDEVLIALSICAVHEETARRALDCLKQLKWCDAHSTVILPQIDEDVLKKLGIQMSCEPAYQTKKLYHR
ncbi:MAG: DUF1846 domain-containing protein [Clostridia bacterium]|nr:DUF1846 domain-containing protein [Clostridia bacterium]MBQ9803195.1 DUF1846 domain-containing protein [Clostridia bacterium]